MRIFKFIIFILTLDFALLAFADEIPIEDLSQNAASQNQPAAALTQTQTAPEPTPSQDVSTQTQDLSAYQRLSRLEQQMQNMTQMNMPQQINNLQQQVQQLRGELDEQTHQIQTLQEQLRNFYTDLDQRLNNIPSRRGGSGTALDSRIAPQTSGQTIDIISGPEDQAYKTAFASLGAKKYDNAVKLMQKYLSDYPAGKYAANAHYWLGEIYYLQSKLPQSAVEMQAVIKQFAQSPKVPDAMLKMAMIYNEQDKYDQARSELQQIKKQYPQSTAAQLVDQQLQLIGAKDAAGSGIDNGQPE